MILIDFSQIFHANLHVYVAQNKMLDYEGIRNMLLLSIAKYNKQFKDTHGDIIICCDGQNVWRKNSFLEYKFSRGKERSKSSIDWKEVYEIFNRFISELEEFFPYTIVKVQGAEADDIIATCCNTYSNEPIMIISGDKDFGQLQIHENVRQFNPIKKKEIKIDNPKNFLYEQILTGDVSDGVPNFLSDDDTYKNPDKRAKPLTAKKKEALLKNPSLFFNPESIMTTTEFRNFQRNKMMIDLVNEIPEYISSEIIKVFEEERSKEKTRLKMRNYFFKNQMKYFMDRLSDF